MLLKGVLFLALCALSTATITCPGGGTCQDGQTCCTDTTGQPSCCPAASATCCSDHVHCCPSQYPVCDVEHGQCLSQASLFTSSFFRQSISSTDMLERIPAAAAAQKADDAAVPQAIVDHVNSVGTTWKAHDSPHFKGWTVDQATGLMGTVVGDGVFRLPEKERDDAYLAIRDEDVPAQFDSRTAFSECAGVIGHVRDQASCGSCWAFGSTEAFNDRLCIASKGKFQTLLSVEDTTACCGFLKCFSMGCNGGQPSGAWRFFNNYGVVTGGDYEDIGKGGTCLPYQIPSCAHHVVDPTRPNCTEGGSTPKCASSCSENKYGTAFSDDKHKAASSYSLSDVTSIKKDIMAYGPVTGAFTVYADFPSYKSGIYQHVTGSQLGGHAIKIIGWGTEDGTDYWLVMNSWNENWGDKGLFKIKQGDCGIDSQISAGHVTA